MHIVCWEHPITAHAASGHFTTTGANDPVAFNRVHPTYQYTAVTFVILQPASGCTADLFFLRVFHIDPLKPSGHYMYHQFNTHKFYVLPTHTVFVCFVCISEQTAIISLYSINWLAFITETECVYCAVRTECLCINNPLKPQWSLYVPPV